MKKDYKVPEWVKHGKLRWAWALWEPLAHYRRQGGAPSSAGVWNARWGAQYYKRMHSEEIVAKLADMGINLVSTSFFKGFGIESGVEEMERTAEFAELCHSYGIRVLGYHQLTTIIYETMLKEVPNLEEWAMVDAQGNKLIYWNSYWRWLACATSDEHIEYLKKPIYKAIKDAKLDGIQFDGGTFYDCHCERCQQSFREYLLEKYKDASCKEIQERFGIGFIDYVRIPPMSHPWDPLYQELVAFRYKVKDERLIKLHRYIKELNPDAILSTYMEPSAFATKEYYVADLIIGENLDLPHIHGDEGVINRVLHCKTAQAVDRVILNTSWFREPGKPGLRRAETSEEVKLDLAEHGAFGGQAVAATWALRPSTPPEGCHFERTEIYEPMKQYMTFYKDHEELYENVKCLANVGLYWSYESMTFDEKVSYPGLVGFEQALMWNQIPHSIVPSNKVEEINAFGVIILAEQTCLSDREVKFFEDFVKSGGGLVITGQTGIYDENLRLRESPALSSLLENDNVVYLKDACGNIRPLPNKTKATDFYIPHLPEKHYEMVKAIEKVCKGPLPFKVSVTGYIAADLYQVKSGARVLHLINYDNKKPLDDVDVTVNLPFKGDLIAKFYTPDYPELSGNKLAIAQDREEVKIKVPKLETYCCIAFEER